MTACRFCGYQDEPLTDHVLTEVATEHGISVNEMVSPARTAPLFWARACAAYRLREELGLALKTIGFVLGGRDHSTVMHALDRMRKRLDLKTVKGPQHYARDP